MTGTGVAVLGANALDTIRDQMAPGASDEELAYFGAVCNRLGLSPFADQIVLIGRYDNRLKREVYRHQLTVAGRRALADRTGRLAGIEGPVWCGPRNEQGALEWRDVWDDDTEPPYCARVLVHVHGWTVAANGTAKWSEFAVTTKDGGLTPMWKSMPSHMLGKCAESLALRRAFPDALPPDVINGFAEQVMPRLHPDDAPERSVVAEVEAGPPPFNRVMFAKACEDAGLDVADVLAYAQIDRPVHELTEQDRPALKDAIAALTSREGL